MNCPYSKYMRGKKRRFFARLRMTMLVFETASKNSWNYFKFKYIIINWIWGRYGFDGKRRAKGSMP